MTEDTQGAAELKRPENAKTAECYPTYTRISLPVKDTDANLFYKLAEDRGLSEPELFEQLLTAFERNQEDQEIP